MYSKNDMISFLVILTNSANDLKLYLKFVSFFIINHVLYMII